MNNYGTIFEAYKKPSEAKIKAWEYCKELCDKYNGNNLRVVSKNMYMFSAMFNYTNEKGEKMFCKITPTKNLFGKDE